MGFRLFRDGQLQLALVQQRQKVPCTHHHLHLDLSIPLGKPVDRGGEQTGGNAGICADTDSLKLFSFDFFKSFFQCGFRTQQFLHPGQKPLSLWRQMDAGVVSRKESHVPFLFQGVQGVCEAGLGVAFRKGSQAVLSDAVGMPEVVGKVHPLLGAVPADWAVKALTDAGERLLQQGDQVVGGRGFLFGGQMELAVKKTYKFPRFFPTDLSSLIPIEKGQPCTQQDCPFPISSDWPRRDAGVSPPRLSAQA